MLKIIRAFYSVLDVTNILNNRIIDNKLNIHVSNAIFGDPTPNVYLSNQR